MSKQAVIDWGETFLNYKSPAFQWSTLFVIYLLANFFIQGWGHIAFTYTMVYALAFLLIAITIAKSTGPGDKKIGTLFAIMTLFVGFLTWITSGAYISPDAGMWLAIVFTALALVNQGGWISTTLSINNKYCLLGALGGIFLFGLLYFLGRLGLIPVTSQFVYWQGPLPVWTILNHLGIMLLAGTDLLLILGLGEWEKWNTYRWIFWFLTVIGGLWILYEGWGLALLG